MLIKFFNLLAWVVIVINTLAWAATLYTMKSEPWLRPRVDFSDFAMVVAICWLIVQATN